MRKKRKVVSGQWSVFGVRTRRAARASVRAHAGFASPSPWGKGREGELLHFVLVGLATLALLAGCVSKSKAKADARNAFIAGQQESLRHQQQNQVPSVTILGQVATSVVAWSQDLTLAQALVTASYTGRNDPSEIIIVRRGVASRIDPKKLLAGEDIPLQPGDIIQIRQ